MLSTPHKRFAWAKMDRVSELSFFRSLVLRRRRLARVRKEREIVKWKPAAWTPWLWMK